MGDEEAPQGRQEGVRGYEDGLGGCQSCGTALLHEVIETLEGNW